MTEKLVKSVTVPLPPDEAFALFTDDIASWWPLDSHSLSAAGGETATSVAVEPREGGQIFETMPDGRTAPWATITEWQQGERLSFDWYVGRDREDATQVQVSFTPDGTGTRVELIHDGFDRLGSEAETACANYNTGWDHVLGACYGTRCQKQAA